MCAPSSELRFGKKYRIKTKIGGGSFGTVVCGEHVVTHEEVALKLESIQQCPPQLAYEYKIYRQLHGAVGIPYVKWHGAVGDYNVLVMDLLGHSLATLFEMCQRRFSLKTVLMLADQMLLRIQYVHSKAFIHRDMKPDNFVIGRNQTSNVLYLIDFGLSRHYKNPKTNQHITYKDGKGMTGTARYASLNTHLGIEQSRRDDLEGIAYILIYFMRGNLPWQGIKGKTRKQKYDLIGEKKLATPVEVLCSGLPSEFGTFLMEVRKLSFLDKPDYETYRRLFRNLFVREGYSYDYQYDWVLFEQNAEDAFTTEHSPHPEEEFPVWCPQVRQPNSAQANSQNRNIPLSGFSLRPTRRLPPVRPILPDLYAG